MSWQGILHKDVAYNVQAFMKQYLSEPIKILFEIRQSLEAQPDSYNSKDRSLGSSFSRNDENNKYRAEQNIVDFLHSSTLE